MVSILSIYLYTFAALAFQGTATSGGGGAFVQRDVTGKVQSALLIDIWEAQHIPFQWPNRVGTLHIKDETSESVDTLIASAITRLSKADPTLATQVRLDYEYVRSHVRVLPPGVRIQLPADLKLDYFPSGFPAEGMMRFNGLTVELDLDVEIFGSLISSRHMAGAWLHEAIYKTMRETTFRHDNSIYSRHLNACLLSEDEACLPTSFVQIPRDRWVFKCSGATVDYWVYPLSRKAPYYPQGYRVVFARFGQPFSTDVHQDILQNQIFFNPDDTIVAASSGRLVSPLEIYGFNPGTAVVELKLSAQGMLLSALTRTAISSLDIGMRYTNEGFDLLPYGSEAATCRPY
ncbi:MAG: hypothetical protein KF799_00110 [Bdellovibrionales bacterium]|nr:hypothetical protein [Bdellovibrionales bacterium]